MATYPSNPNLPQGTYDTAVNPANWNTLINNINSMGADLVEARGDVQIFPGVPHTPGQCSDVKDSLNAIRHQIATISGETNWYDDTLASLKSHNHSTDKGGAIPWSSIGTGNRSISLYPEYPGGVWTTSLRGSAPSGNNTLERSTGQDVVSYVVRNYYEAISSESSLQDYYIGLIYTIPENFNVWASSNAILVEYKTGSGASINCGVDIFIYKSGNANLIASSENNINTSWSNISINNSILGTWLPGDIMELYVKLKTKSNYYARVGRINFNFTS